MDLSELKIVLSEFISKNDNKLVLPMPSDAPGYFTLPDNITQLFTLFSASINASTLMVKNPTLELHSNTLNVKGDANYLSGSNLAISLQFSLDDTALQLLLSLALPINWHFSKSFSGVAETQLDSLSFTDGVLLYASESINTTIESVKVNLKSGLNFSAKTDISSGWLSTIGSWSDIKSTCLYGALDLTRPSVPKLQLRSTQSDWTLSSNHLIKPAIPPSIALQDAQLVISGEYSEQYGTYLVKALLNHGQAHITESSTKLDLSFPLNLTYGDWLVLSSVSGLEDQAPDFTQLGKLAGGDVLVPGLTALSSSPIGMTAFSTSIYLPETQLTQIGFSIGLKKSAPPLQVVPKLMEIKDIEFDFNVTDPFDKNNRLMTFTLTANFLFGKSLAIDLTASYPSSLGLAIYGSLPKDQTIDLSHLADYFKESGDAIAKAFADILGSLPTLTFSKTAFAIYPAAKQFSINSIMKTTQDGKGWQLVPAFNLCLNKVSFDFDIGAQKGLALSGTVIGYFDIGGTSLKITLMLPFKEMQLTGEQTGDPVSVGQFVSGIGNTIGIHDMGVPAFLNNIEFYGLTLSYAKADDRLAFSGACQISMADTKIVLGLDIHLQKGKGTYTGSLTLADCLFEITADTTTDTTLTASWKALSKNDYLELQDVADVFKLTLPPIPDDLDLALCAASISYDFTSKALTLKAQSANYGKAVFATLKLNNQREVFVGLAIDKTLDLTDIPLIGKPISQVTQVALKSMTVDISSLQVDKKSASTISKQIGNGYPNPPSDGIGRGVLLSAALDAGGIQIPLQLALTKTQKKSASQYSNFAGQSMLTSAPVLSTNDCSAPLAKQKNEQHGETVWFNLEKTFGPISIQKIGLRYEDSKIWALMNASLTAGPVQVGTYGLGIGSPLNSFEPSFTLSGADVTVTAGTFEASGGLIGSIDPVNLYGELLLEFDPYSVGALAGFAIEEGDPSFFLYATVLGDFGGPPYFFISGFAAGLGLNRSLIVPPVSGVADFPLVAWAQGQNSPPSSIAGSDVTSQVSDTLSQLEQSGVLAPAKGEYWLAAGISFSSFEVVNSFLLATVAFGAEFEFDLLGLATLQLPPQPAGPIVNIELQLKATVNPKLGFFSIEGQLTNNSYVIDPNARLTGGFAFYVVFAGENEGAFVITVGGYSDRYKVPSYFPQVPRLGLNWRITSELSVTGQQYFALTPAAVMAGCAISAVWHSGAIRAWFNVRGDFLMIYKPFHYYVSASCQLGCSVRISLLFTHVTLSFHLGAGIEIWGPEFTGRVHIDLSVVSFTIHFGAANQNNSTTIEWSTFVKELLPGGKQGDQLFLATESEASLDTEPASGSVVNIQISKGLIKTLSNKVGDLNYVVDGEHFEMQIGSSVPIKTTSFSSNITLAPDNQQPQRQGKAIKPNINFGIGPVGVEAAKFSSELDVVLNDQDGASFTAVRVIHNSPTAFWQKRNFSSQGVPNIDPVNDAHINDTLVGYRLTPVVPNPDHTLPIQKSLLEHTNYDTQQDQWAKPVLPASQKFPKQTVAGTIGDKVAQANRQSLLAAINRTHQADVMQQVDVSGLANPETSYLIDSLTLVLLGGLN